MAEPGKEAASAIQGPPGARPEPRPPEAAGRRAEGSSHPRLTVVKVGGSLLTWPELPTRLNLWLDEQRSVQPGSGRPFVLIAGGGPIADVVRELDRVHGLGDEAAHRLAIRSMDVTAELLASLVADSRAVRHPRELVECQTDGLRAIVSASSFLKVVEDTSPDPLPASWDVTSDSIAARIAAWLGADRLVLLKSRTAAAGSTRGEAAAAGLVDPFFPEAARAVDLVEIVCLRDSPPRPCTLRR
ncbi:amino acid kinase family protein [Aquisphaera insulae]|uniref:amino acid kinase family protein n=1 Tax=Aquisphaera insulae TaxID=2712864 RepID=UPI0013ECBF8A|nr:uridylate kinase [Aquisphaera insulae]